jgi:hypothetical protein
MCEATTVADRTNGQFDLDGRALARIERRIEGAVLELAKRYTLARVADAEAKTEVTAAVAVQAQGAAAGWRNLRDAFSEDAG